MTCGSKRKSINLPAEMDVIFTGRLTGGSTSLEHVIGVEGTVFDVLLIISNVWVG